MEGVHPGPSGATAMDAVDHPRTEPKARAMTHAHPRLHNRTFSSIFQYIHVSPAFQFCTVRLHHRLGVGPELLQCPILAASAVDRRNLPPSARHGQVILDRPGVALAIVEFSL
jgi:hypothetical protein